MRWAAFTEKLDLFQRGQAHDKIVLEFGSGVASQLNLPSPI